MESEGCEEYQLLSQNVADLEKLVVEISKEHSAFSLYDSGSAEVLKHNLSLIQLRITKISKNAKVTANSQIFDVTDVPANGFRSIHSIMSMAMCFMTRSFMENLNKTKYKMKNLHELVAIVVMSAEMCEILEAASNYSLEMFQYASRAEQKCMFMPRSGNFDHMLHEQKNILRPVLYGEFVAFQFCKSIRQKIVILMSVMASFSEGYVRHRRKWHRMISSITAGSTFAISSEQRSLRIYEILTNLSADFCKAFWSLASTYHIQTFASIFLPKMSVNQAININKTLKFQVPLHSDVSSSSVTVKEIDFSQYFEPQKSASLSTTRSESTDPAANSSPSVPSFRIISHSGKMSNRLIFYIHGGGFIAQSTDESMIFLRFWAKELKSTIISVDYTLSPEAVYPQALHECFLTYCYVLAFPFTVLSTAEKIVLVGDSAGGNLILALMQKIIQEGIKRPDGLVCVYPATNLLPVPSPSRILGIFDPLLSSESIKLCLCSYLIPGFCFKANDSEISNPSESESSEKSSETKIAAEKPVVSATSSPSRGISSIRRIVSKTSSRSGNGSIKHKRSLSADMIAASDFRNHDPTSILLSPELYRRCLDPLVSPLYASPETFQQFPYTFIIVSDMDPLLDDSIELYRKMRSCNCKVDIHITSCLPHGFLHFNYNSKTADKACKEIFDALSRVIYS